MQGTVKIFLKLTASLGDENINNEQGSKYYMSMVTLFILLFDDDVLLMILFADTIQ